MAIITLKFSDTDVSGGNWRMDITTAGNELDDGQATAAYFTAFYLNSVMNTPDFMAGLAAFGQTVVSGLTEVHGDLPMATMPGSAVITLTDRDLSTGRFATVMEMDGPELETALPTMAQMVGAYVRSLIANQAFMQNVWDFAENYVLANPSGEIANRDSRPVFETPGTVSPIAA